jgi:hypothetical protein
VLVPALLLELSRDDAGTLGFFLVLFAIIAMAIARSESVAATRTGPGSVVALCLAIIGAVSWSFCAFPRDQRGSALIASILAGIAALIIWFGLDHYSRGDWPSGRILIVASGVVLAVAIATLSAKASSELAVPAAPRHAEASADGLLTWTPPASAVEDEIDHYRITIQPSGVSFSSQKGETSATFPKLPPGSYSFSIVAVNASGKSQHAARSNTITIPAVVEPGVVG